MDSTKSEYEVDFPLDPLPKDFVLYKPLQQDRFKESEIYDLEKAGRLIITRKRDGWKMFAVKSGGRIKLYTDGMNEIDNRLEHIKEELAELDILDGSVLVGEALVDLNGDDQFKKVGAILSSSRERAVELQVQYGQMKYMLFEMVSWHSLSYMKNRHIYLSRLKNIKELFEVKAKIRHVMPLTVLDMTYNEAKRLVRKNGWEGLVLYDRNLTLSYRLDGKNPARPKGCYKWKPLYEDDFIVRQWLPKDDDPKQLKEVVLLQINPKTGWEFECGKLGSFDAKMREQLRTAKYPLVMEVQYEARYESGKLRNARFLRLRPDKKVKDCVAPKKFK